MVGRTGFVPAKASTHRWALGMAGSGGQTVTWEYGDGHMAFRRSSVTCIQHGTRNWAGVAGRR